MEVKVRQDKKGDSIFIQFSDIPYSHGKGLDDERYIEYGEGNQLRGVEILDISSGVDLEGLPERRIIEEVLTSRGIKINGSK